MEKTDRGGHGMKYLLIGVTVWILVYLVIRHTHRR